MNDRFKGMILSISDYRENDVLCKVFIKELGIISLVAKGAKKINSKKARIVMPHCLCLFMIDYIENKTIFNIKDVQLLKNYYQKSDILHLSILDLMAYIALNSFHDGISCDVLYDELSMAYEACMIYPRHLVLAMYMAHILGYLGIKPHVDGCVICLDQKVTCISIVDGGFLCQKHMYNKPATEVEVMRKFRYINKLDWKHIDKLIVLKYDMRDLDLMASFFFAHTNFNERIYNFFKSLLVL